jgi:hypothetical protein
LNAEKNIMGNQILTLGRSARAVNNPILDLQKLEADIRAMRLPATEAFFFGSRAAPSWRTIPPSSRRRAALAGNLTVYYTSWW